MKPLKILFSIILISLQCIVLYCTKLQAQTVLINTTSVWKYLDNGSNQGTNWRTAAFYDAEWHSGSAELGFDDSPVTTISDLYIGYYFRKSISITNPSQYSNFTMKVRRDDGIVVYINNVEVFRNNMPSGIISYNTTASSTCSDDGRTIFSTVLLSSLFVAGDNIVTAEVHNRSTSSSDLTFEMKLIGNSLAGATCAIPNSNLFGNRNITSTSAEAYWVPVSGVQYYNVGYRIRNTGANYSLPVTVSSPLIVLTNLQPSTNYEFIVQSVCTGGGVSSFSQSGWITTLPGTNPPQVCSIPDPNTFISNNISSSSAAISWSAIPGVQSYNIEYRILNSQAVYSIPINTGSSSIVLNSLLPSTSYEFIVQSICSGNILSSFSASRTFTTLSGPVSTCAIPDYGLFGTRNRTANSVEVFFKAISGAQSYNIQYRIRNSGAGYSASSNTTTASHVITGLQPVTNYEFIVQTVCTGPSLSAFSSSGWFTTLASTGSTATLIRGPYMTISTSNSITIQWRTNIASSNEVKYGTNSASLIYTASNTNVGTEHSVTLSGLLPNTKYFYSIGPIGVILQGTVSNYFYTAPAVGSTQAVKFWVTGDFGNGSSAQAAVRNSFSNYTASHVVNGWLWLGDNAYSNGTDLEYQTKVFDVYNSIFKYVPVFPAPGNHDYAQSGYQSSASRGVNFPYFNIFTLPSASGTEKYYSTDYSNIHFISLDSYGSYNNSSSAMYNWLEDDLAYNTQQWTIVYFHHPPFSKGSHNSDTEAELIDMRNNIIPLLESYGVDLVLTGHSHSYERSYFIKNHTGPEVSFNSSLYPGGNVVQTGGGPYTKTTRTGNGTVYVVCGVSGQGGGTTSGYPHNAMYRSIIASYGSLILDVDGGSLSCKFLTSTGSIDDQFTILKPLSSQMNNARVSGKTYMKESLPVIYPNPSSGDINIRINNMEKTVIDVTISNTTGMNLYKREFSIEENGEIRIDRSETNLTPGIYIVNISGGNQSLSEKLVLY